MNGAAAVDRSMIIGNIRQFIVEKFLFGIDDPHLTNSGSFLESAIIDSTGILELVGYVEAEFGIKIEDDEMLPQNLDSLTNVSSFVIRKRNRAS